MAQQPAERGASPQKWIGRPLPRLEDARFLRGEGRFTDDINLPGQVWCVFIRSPHAHAEIRSVDCAAGLQAAGVLAILTGADYVAAGHRGMPQGAVSADAVEWQRPAFRTSDGHRIFDRPHMPFAVGRARYAGEIVALVIAQTQDQARAAAERVVIDYAPLPAVTDAIAALATGAPQVWAQAPGNVALDAVVRDRALTADGFARAHLVVEGTFRSARIMPGQLEPRAALGDFDASANQYVLISGCQGVHRVRGAIAAALNVAPERVRAATPDVGGGFGGRSSAYPEQVAVVWAAAHVGRPVKWTGDRAESCLADFQSRDAITHARLALDRDGKILAYDVEMIGNIGAHTVSFTNLHNAWRVGTGVYDIAAASVRLIGALTHTMPTSVYRGAGRPEATLAIERLLDMAARKLAIDRVEIRRRNLVRREQMPYFTAAGLTYDSGDFEGNMDAALQRAGWSDFATRRALAKVRGRLSGIGLANSIETPVGMPHERAELLVTPQGRVELKVGTQSSGQGHETVYAQVVADLIGVTPDDVDFVGGDTALVESGGGTHSDRSLRLAGALIVEAGEAVIAQGRGVAAALLNVDVNDVRFDEGFFQSAASNRRLDVFDLAPAIERNAALPEELRAPLGARKTFTGRIPAHPTGAAVCEVEIDPETGMVEVTRYTTVHDAGQPINPLILHGQTHGAIAQGVGPALMEAARHDAEGQVLTGSFMDYAMPRADMLPMLDVEFSEDPTKGNVLRVKGGGEGGTTPAPAAVMNAILDALAPLGVTHLDLPATPLAVWRSIKAARVKQG